MTDKPVKRIQITPAQRRTLNLINAGYTARVLPKVRGKFRTPATNTAIYAPDGNEHSYTGETTVQRLHELGMITCIAGIYQKLVEGNDHALTEVQEG